ncbi:hypothetical protein GLN3_09220 [Geobacillus lituanicus]|nr:hypothetical protein GLN3_09220 [Geobacillus lituanicus]
MRSGKDITEEAMSCRSQYHQVWENLYVKEITTGDSEACQRYVLCTVQKKRNVKTRAKKTVGDTESGIGRASIAAE